MTAYYVDAIEGNDLSPGTSTLWPWRTSEKVADWLFWPGDRIRFRRGGDYGRLAVPSNISGTVDMPIAFGPYGYGALPRFIPEAGDVEAVWCNVPYVTFRGLAVMAPNADGVSGISIGAQGIGNDLRRLYVIGTDTVHSTRGIQTRAFDTVIVNNDVRGTTLGVMVLPSVPGRAAKVRVSSNVIASLTGGVPQDGDGIVINGINEPDCSGVIVSSNDVSGYQEDGVDIWQAFGVTVEHNRLHDPIPGPWVCGVRSKGVEGQIPNLIRYNHIVNMLNPEGQGVGICPRVGQYIIQGNYIRNVTGRCVSLWGGASADIYENMLLDTPVGIMCTSGASMQRWDNMFRTTEADIVGC